jgi:hypothetical protein
MFLGIRDHKFLKQVCIEKARIMKFVSKRKTIATEGRNKGIGVEFISLFAIWFLAFVASCYKRRP